MLLDLSCDINLLGEEERKDVVFQSEGVGRSGISLGEHEYV